MNKIEVLDQNTIDKIAAGEVVERPSSVVKELVENAIDAGASAVTVEILDGGRSMIRITDNGSGIDPDQVRTAFLSHATSKIRKIEDLENIVSLGFRGEALSSIAAVSKVELITRTRNSLGGIRYLIEGGQEAGMEEIGAPEGTTFLVRDLFYNTPARQKFLKSDMTEANVVSSMMEQLALSHPEISFKYIQNRQVKLHTSGNSDRKEVVYNVYGREIAKSLIEIDVGNDFMHMQGFVGKPEIARGNRTFENYYVNGRYVKNRIITKGIEDGYRNFLMQHRFPFILLYIEMNGNDLDVNVHPSKMEVRFARGEEVYEFICDAVRNTLSGRELIRKVSPEKTEPRIAERLKPAEIPEPFERKRMASVLRETPVEVESVSKQYAAPEPKAAASAESAPRNWKPVELVPRDAKPAKPAPEMVKPAEPSAKKAKSPEPVSAEAVSALSAEPKQESLFQDDFLTEKARVQHRIIGQLFDTYWLVEYRDNFYIIDQHAAHEKVNYERFVKDFKEKTVESQNLNPPILVTLSLEEEAVFLQNKNLFASYGFEVDHYGGREYAVKSVPLDLYYMGEEEFFKELLDSLSAFRTKEAAFDVFAAKLALMSCKASVKGGQRLSPAEAEKLIDSLLNLENPYNCPHGRPTIIRMSRNEIEKKFKRIV